MVTISFDFSMKIYGYTGFYLCRMPSAPLNLNNITLDLSLFLSVSIFWYFYEIVLLFMLFFFMSVLSANLNLNNITRQILIRFDLPDIDLPDIWPFFLLDIMQKSKYRTFLLKTLRFQQTLLTFWLQFHSYFHSNLLYELVQNFLDRQFYFQIEQRNSKKMIFNLRTICFLCITRSSLFFGNINTTHAYDLFFLGNPSIADFDAHLLLVMWRLWT